MPLCKSLTAHVVIECSFMDENVTVLANMGEMAGRAGVAGVADFERNCMAGAIGLGGWNGEGEANSLSSATVWHVNATNIC